MDIYIRIDLLESLTVNTKRWTNFGLMPANVATKLDQQTRYTKGQDEGHVGHTPKRSEIIVIDRLSSPT